jgi:hypothetical protein
MNLTDKKIILTSCVRNCATTLPTVIKKFIQIYSCFSVESKIILIENDSTDGSKEFLENMSKSFSFIKIFSFQGLIEKKPLRTDRLAFCRNFAMNYIHKNHSDFDFIIIADCDEVMANFNVKCIQTAIDFTETTEPNWGMISATSLPKYYDIWALRSKFLGVDFDCWDLIHHEMAQVGSSAINSGRWRYIEPWQKKIEKSAGLIPVQSAFNGFAIYKLPATRNCKYAGINSTCQIAEIFGTKSGTGPCNKEVCEHVAFHKDMIDQHGAKLFICPFLETCAELAHLVHPK